MNIVDGVEGKILENQSSLSLRKLGTALVRYTAAAAATLVALVVSHALDSFIGTPLPYILLFPAITFAAWYCGVGPSVLATPGLFFRSAFAPGKLHRQWYIAQPTDSIRSLGSAAVVLKCAGSPSGSEGCEGSDRINIVASASIR